MSLTQVWGLPDPDWRWEDKKPGGIKRNERLLRATDGCASLCRDGPGRSRRGLDWTGCEGLVRVCAMPYKAEMVRADDVALAQSQGKAVTMKVLVREPPGLSPTDTVEVGGRAYEVTRADRDGRDCHLYLSELTAAAEVELVSVEARRDEWGQWSSEESRQRALAREVAASWDGSPGLAVTLRTCDYAGEPLVESGGRRYSVVASKCSGQWTELSCKEEEKDVL